MLVVSMSEGAKQPLLLFLLECAQWGRGWYNFRNGTERLRLVPDFTRMERRNALWFAGTEP